MSVYSEFLVAPRSVQSGLQSDLSLEWVQSVNLPEKWKVLCQ